jgi:hypothetical protein
MGFLMKFFWKWLTLFGWRRWVDPTLTPPTGIPNMRDPEARCPAYEPRPRKKFLDWGSCQTDGHYLCNECCHRVEQRDDDEELISLNI